MFGWRSEIFFIRLVVQAVLVVQVMCADTLKN